MPYIIPAEGLLIPDPVQLGTPNRFLPVKGREVEWSEYWNRREIDGDVIRTDPPQEVTQ